MTVNEPFVEGSLASAVFAIEIVAESSLVIVTVAGVALPETETLLEVGFNVTTTCSSSSTIPSFNTLTSIDVDCDPGAMTTVPESV